MAGDLQLPTVHHVYPTKCATLDKPPGFGDYLRGSIALAHHARERKFDLRLDFSRHPMRHFLRGQEELAPSAGAVDEFFDDRATLIYDWLDDLQAGGAGFACTNLLPHASRIDDGILASIRDQLQFSSEILDTSRLIRDQVTADSFAAIHLRFSDDDFETDKGLAGKLFDHIEATIIPTWGRRLAVVSNNAYAKRALSERYGLHHIDTRAVHLGQGNGSQSDVRDTLIDFALMAQASEIYSHSAYTWKSGFSHWCATLHGIPFHPMVIESRGPGAFLRNAARGLKNRLGV